MRLTSLLHHFSFIKKEKKRKTYMDKFQKCLAKIICKSVHTTQNEETKKQPPKLLSMEPNSRPSNSRLPMVIDGIWTYYRESMNKQFRTTTLGMLLLSGAAHDLNQATSLIQLLTSCIRHNSPLGVIMNNLM